MKSVSAYTSKLRAEVKGRTQKVQDDDRSVTTGIYRGTAGCGQLNFSQIVYAKRQKCCFVVRKVVRGAVIINISGGFNEAVGRILDGGFNQAVGQIFDGGTI